MDNNQKVFQHLDQLRIDHGFTVDQFCDGITTDRQYRRYVSGTSVVSPKNLDLFCKKLHLTIDEFYFSFYHNDKVEYQKVVAIYKLISSKNTTEAKRLMDELPDEKYLTQETRQFLSYCKIMYGFETKQYTQAHTIDLLHKVIDYPNCTTKNTLSLIEVISIRAIVRLNAFIGKYEDADRLYDIIQNPKRQFVNENTRSFLPNIYLTLSQAYGMKEDFTLAIKLAQEGIKASIKGNYIVSLDSLYYILSNCQFKIGNRQSAYEAAKQCIATCIAKDNDQLIQFYNSMFEKEQGYTFSIQEGT